MIRTGPDGALWVADMYREIIEHPRWVKEELKPLVDRRTGTDRGRIYRILPADAQRRPIQRIDQLSPGDLVASLDNPNMTVRDLVHRRIVQEKMAAAVKPLAQLARESKRPAVRLQALCVLDGLDELPMALVEQALADPHAEVRREALRLCEGRFDAASARLNSLLVGLVHDPSDSVRLQLAATIGEWSDPAVAEIAAQLLQRDRDSPYVVAAVMSSIDAENVGNVLRKLLPNAQAERPPAELIGKLIAMAGRFQQFKAASDSLEIILGKQDQGYQPWQFASMLAMLNDLPQPVGPWARQLPDEGSGLQDRLREMFAAAAELAFDDAAHPTHRATAVGLLGGDAASRTKLAPRLATLLSPQSPIALQIATARTIARLATPDTPALLLARWTSHEPRLRAEILDLLISRRNDWALALFAAIDDGKVRAADINNSQREKLRRRNGEVRARANRLLTATTTSDRAGLVTQYMQFVPEEGDAGRGQKLFAKRCAACHRLQETGNHVGPDLRGLTDKSASSLLTAILDPNRAVEPRYISYTAITANGRIFTGMLADQSGASLTLLDAEGKPHQILRRDLEELTANGKSLMPEGLEKDLPPEAMGDLLAYLAAALSATK